MEMKSVLVLARVTFLSKEHGGRSNPAINSDKYRPSAVLGDVNQRHAIFGQDGRTLIEPYRMTAFAGDGEPMLAGNPYEKKLSLLAIQA